MLGKVDKLFHSKQAVYPVLVSSESKVVTNYHVIKRVHTAIVKLYEPQSTRSTSSRVTLRVDIRDLLCSADPGAAVAHPGDRAAAVAGLPHRGASWMRRRPAQELGEVGHSRIGGKSWRARQLFDRTNNNKRVGSETLILLT